MELLLTVSKHSNCGVNLQVEFLLKENGHNPRNGQEKLFSNPHKSRGWPSP